MLSKKITICYLPGRESTYVRTRVLLKGLEAAGIHVLDCSHSKKNILRYFYSFRKFLKYKNQSDFILVGFFGQFLIPIVRLFTRKKIIFEAFLSAYQTLCFDRRSIKPKSFQAQTVRFIEKLSCQLSDIILLDTEQHISYFVKEYGLKREKFHRSFLGADDAIMYPRQKQKKNKIFLVHFHGEYQALHGIKYIIESAAKLPDIQFQLIGAGAEYQQRRKQAEVLNLKNINFISYVMFDKIPDYISQADVCIGIVGETEKTRLVIPFKVYETLAMAKPIITADTLAIRELLTDEKNVKLCQAADSDSLVEAIIRLKNNPELCSSISQNALKIFKEKCAPKIIGEEILRIIKDETNF